MRDRLVYCANVLLWPCGSSPRCLGQALEEAGRWLIELLTDDIAPSYGLVKFLASAIPSAE